MGKIGSIQAHAKYITEAPSERKPKKASKKIRNEAEKWKKSDEEMLTLSGERPNRASNQCTLLLVSLAAAIRVGQLQMRCAHSTTHKISYQNISQFFYVAVFFPYLFADFFFFFAFVRRVCACVCVCVRSTLCWCWCVQKKVCLVCASATLRTHTSNWMCLVIVREFVWNRTAYDASTHSVSVPLELLLATPSTFRIHSAGFFGFALSFHYVTRRIFIFFLFNDSIE